MKSESDTIELSSILAKHYGNIISSPAEVKALEKKLSDFRQEAVQTMGIVNNQFSVINQKIFTANNEFINLKKKMDTFGNQFIHLNNKIDTIGDVIKLGFEQFKKQNDEQDQKIEEHKEIEYAMEVDANMDLGWGVSKRTYVIQETFKCKDVEFSRLKK